MALHCPECGFVNPEGANYCQKCGAYLGRAEGNGEEPTTMTYRVDETGELTADRHRRGGRGSGRRARDPLRRRPRRRELHDRPGPDVASAAPPTPRSSSTTSPSRATTPFSCAARTAIYIDDLGSLNGTYVNRRRIESHKLDDGDEIQIGKFKLSYLER